MANVVEIIVQAKDEFSAPVDKLSRTIAEFQNKFAELNAKINAGIAANARLAHDMDLLARPRRIVFDFDTDRLKQKIKELETALEPSRLQAKIQALQKELSGVGKGGGGLLGGLQNLNLSSLGGIATSLAAIAGGGILAAVAIEKLGAAMKFFVGTAAEAELADVKFGQALAITNQFSVAGVNRMRDYANAIQATTTQTDEAVRSAAALIAQIGGLSGGVLERATSAAVDLAAVMGTDLQTAAQQVARASTGATQGLERLIGQIKEGKTPAETFANVLTALETRMGGSAAAQANTLTGAFARLKNQLSETVEAIALASPAFAALGSIMNSAAAAVLRFNQSIGTPSLSLIQELDILVGQLERVGDRADSAHGSIKNFLSAEAVKKIDLLVEHGKIDEATAAVEKLRAAQLAILNQPASAGRQDALDALANIAIPAIAKFQARLVLDKEQAARDLAVFGETFAVPDVRGKLSFDTDAFRSDVAGLEKAGVKLTADAEALKGSIGAAVEQTKDVRQISADMKVSIPRASIEQLVAQQQALQAKLSEARIKLDTSPEDPNLKKTAADTLALVNQFQKLAPARFDLLIDDKAIDRLQQLRSAIQDTVDAARGEKLDLISEDDLRRSTTLGQELQRDRAALEQLVAVGKGEAAATALDGMLRALAAMGKEIPERASQFRAFADSLRQGFEGRIALRVDAEEARRDLAGVKAILEDLSKLEPGKLAVLDTAALVRSAQSVEEAFAAVGPAIDRALAEQDFAGTIAVVNTLEAAFNKMWAASDGSQNQDAIDELNQFRLAARAAAEALAPLDDAAKLKRNFEFNVELKNFAQARAELAAFVRIASQPPFDKSLEIQIEVQRMKASLREGEQAARDAHRTIGDSFRQAGAEVVQSGIETGVRSIFDAMTTDAVTATDAIKATFRAMIDEIIAQMARMAAIKIGALILSGGASGGASAITGGLFPATTPPPATTFKGTVEPPVPPTPVTIEIPPPQLLVPTVPTVRVEAPSIEVAQIVIPAPVIVPPRLAAVQITPPEVSVSQIAIPAPEVLLPTLPAVRIAAPEVAAAQITIPSPELIEPRVPVVRLTVPPLEVASLDAPAVRIGDVGELVLPAPVVSIGGFDPVTIAPPEVLTPGATQVQVALTVGDLPPVDVPAPRLRLAPGGGELVATPSFVTQDAAPVPVSPQFGLVAAPPIAVAPRFQAPESLPVPLAPPAFAVGQVPPQLLAAPEVSSLPPGPIQVEATTQLAGDPAPLRIVPRLTLGEVPQLVAAARVAPLPLVDLPAPLLRVAAGIAALVVTPAFAAQPAAAIPVTAQFAVVETTAIPITPTFLVPPAGQVPLVAPQIVVGPLAPQNLPAPTTSVADPERLTFRVTAGLAGPPAPVAVPAPQITVAAPGPVEIAVQRIFAGEPPPIQVTPAFQADTPPPLRVDPQVTLGPIPALVPQVEIAPPVGFVLPAPAINVAGVADVSLAAPGVSIAALARQAIEAPQVTLSEISLAEPVVRIGGLGALDLPAPGLSVGRFADLALPAPSVDVEPLAAVSLIPRLDVAALPPIVPALALGPVPDMEVRAPLLTIGALGAQQIPAPPVSVDRPGGVSLAAPDVDVATPGRRFIPAPPVDLGEVTIAAPVTRIGPIGPVELPAPRVFAGPLGSVQLPAPPVTLDPVPGQRLPAPRIQLGDLAQLVVQPTLAKPDPLAPIVPELRLRNTSVPALLVTAPRIGFTRPRDQTLPAPQIVVGALSRIQMPGPDLSLGSPTVSVQAPTVELQGGLPAAFDLAAPELRIGAVAPLEDVPVDLPVVFADPKIPAVERETVNIPAPRLQLPVLRPVNLPAPRVTAQRVEVPRATLVTPRAPAAAAQLPRPVQAPPVAALAPKPIAERLSPRLAVRPPVFSVPDSQQRFALRAPRFERPAIDDREIPIAQPAFGLTGQPPSLLELTAPRVEVGEIGAIAPVQIDVPVSVPDVKAPRVDATRIAIPRPLVTAPTLPRISIKAPFVDVPTVQAPALRVRAPRTPSVLLDAPAVRVARALVPRETDLVRPAVATRGAVVGSAPVPTRIIQAPPAPSTRALAIATPRIAPGPPLATPALDRALARLSLPQPVSVRREAPRLGVLDFARGFERALPRALPGFAPSRGPLESAPDRTARFFRGPGGAGANVTNINIDAIDAASVERSARSGSLQKGFQALSRSRRS